MSTNDKVEPTALRASRVLKFPRLLGTHSLLTSHPGLPSPFCVLHLLESQTSRGSGQQLMHAVTAGSRRLLDSSVMVLDGPQ